MYINCRGNFHQRNQANGLVLDQENRLCRTYTRAELQIQQIQLKNGQSPQGKQIGLITKALIDQQLARPNLSAEEAKEYILENF